jgi:hypothetical protein
MRQRSWNKTHWMSFQSGHGYPQGHYNVWQWAPLGLSANLAKHKALRNPAHLGGVERIVASSLLRLFRLRAAFWFRHLQWILLFSCQLGVVGLGLYLSLLLGLVLSILTGFYNPSLSLFFGGFFGGLVLTACGLVAFRRRTTSWEVAYELEVWKRWERERREHPTRAKYKRRAHRVLRWMPSVLAAAVLFFLPVMSHLLHPSSHYLRHYKVPIPWNMLVVTSFLPPMGSDYAGAFAVRGWKGRFGMMTFLDDAPTLSSYISFSSLSPEDEARQQVEKSSFPAKAHTAPDRVLHLAEIELNCWVTPYLAVRYAISCETPNNAGAHNLYARFDGSERDVLAFYSIVEHIQPAE